MVENQPDIGSEAGFWEGGHREATKIAARPRLVLDRATTAGPGCGVTATGSRVL